MQAIYAICENASRLFDQLSLLSLDDRAQFYKWNSSILIYLEHCVYDLVLNKMAKQPKKLVISAWNNKIIYNEINKASCRLVYYLIERDVNPNVIIDIYINKSKLRAIAIIIILCVDNIVVSLRVQQSLVCIESIIQNTITSLILIVYVYKQQLASLRVHIQFLVINFFFKTFLSILTTISFVESCIIVYPNYVTQVIYISSSIDKPKDVVLQHSSLATSIFFYSRKLDIQSYNYLLQFATFIFDTTIQEIIIVFVFEIYICLPSKENRTNRFIVYLFEINVIIVTLTSIVIILIRLQNALTIQTIILISKAI